jgi:hypothetical protein
MDNFSVAVSSTNFSKICKLVYGIEETVRWWPCVVNKNGYKPEFSGTFVWNLPS